LPSSDHPCLVFKPVCLSTVCVEFINVCVCVGILTCSIVEQQHDDRRCVLITVQDRCDTVISPSACLLRFLKLPEDCHKLVSLKDAAVILMAYMEQMTNSYVHCHGLYKVPLLTVGILLVVVVVVVVVE